eukprot:TRINITY_DN5415_c2_g1_i1.p1 TRINITY_DN5415_c2_g1~~TRINITY_DN5415_c2_g1_i1.p1  ORF type:complete len:141 (-),score=26.86 TRINITY_DN5415_c2_g1_i1:412-834(-)
MKTSMSTHVRQHWSCIQSKDFDELGSEHLGDVVVPGGDLLQCIPSLVRRSYISGNRKFGVLEHVIEYVLAGIWKFHFSTFMLHSRIESSCFNADDPLGLNSLSHEAPHKWGHSGKMSTMPSTMQDILITLLVGLSMSISV